MTANTERTIPLLAKIVLVPLGVLALLLSWCVLFFYLNLGSEILMAPWEYDERGIPAVGTLPREVNDFFDGSGSGYFALCLLVIHYFVAVISLICSRVSRTLQLWKVVLSNFAYVAVVYLSYGLATIVYSGFNIPTPVTPRYDVFGVGYFFALLGIYLALQAFLIPRKGLRRA